MKPAGFRFEAGLRIHASSSSSCLRCHSAQSCDPGQAPCSSCETAGRARGRICVVQTRPDTIHCFRRIALALEGAIEGAHMGHPDFRVDKRIFASLHGDNQFGMVKLTPDQQATFIEDHPKAFTPEAGAWGRSGCTRVILTAIDEDTLGEALTLAWRNTRKTSRKKCR